MGGPSFPLFSAFLTILLTMSYSYLSNTPQVLSFILQALGLRALLHKGRHKALPEGLGYGSDYYILYSKYDYIM